MSAKIVSAPEGTPYHLLQRTPRHRWWRTLLGFPVLAALAGTIGGLLFIAAIVAQVPMSDDPMRISDDPNWELAIALLSLVVLLPALFLTVRLVQRRPAGTLSSVRGRLRWRWMLECACWALLGFAAVFAFDQVRGAGFDTAAWPGWQQIAVIVVLTITLAPFQSAAEEYLCRGFLLQSFASWFRTPWPGAVLVSLLFVVLHDYQDPLVLADLFVFGMALSWVTIRTGGLEAAIALHVVNNVSSFLLAAGQGDVWFEQTGDYRLLDVLPTTLLTIAFAWWIDRRGRARRFRGENEPMQVVGRPAGTATQSPSPLTIGASERRVVDVPGATTLGPVRVP